MEEDQPVHAAWQLRDVWEGLLKFLGTLAVADHQASASVEDPRTDALLKQLLKKDGLSNGTWAKLIEIALRNGPLPKARVPELAPILFKDGKPEKLYRLFMNDTDDLSRDDFISWRNSCFGHGVFRKDLRSYAREALHWLGRLHEAFELCRPVLQSLALESDGPNGEILTWGEKSPLPFYHGHQPALAGPLLPPVRVRTSGSETLLLTPLLSVQMCSVCGQWTAFYLDKYDRDKHRAQFLDFVEGHSNEHKDLEPLRTWAARISGAKTEVGASPRPDPDERQEPDLERFRDFQHEFEPPAYLARQVAEFMQTHDRGVIAITGPGGIGKSWAIEGLDHSGMLPAQLGRAVPMLTATMHGPATPRASTVRTELEECARGEKRWQVPPWPHGPEPRTRFAAWMAALMRANGLGELLVALDGLDDLPADSDVPDLLPAAGKLPQGCYLVLSSRPDVRAAAEGGLRRVRSMPEHFCEVHAGPDEAEYRSVLRSYVLKRLGRPRPDGQGRLPAAWADPLIEQAGGSFLYVFHYCRALHFGVYTDLSQLPPPSAYYPAFFDHLRSRVGDQLFHGHYARALAFIAVAREPVGLRHLEAWGLKRSDLVVILDDLADLLRTRREPWDSETLYGLGHDAVRQFLTEDKYWQSRLARANSDLAKLTVRRFGNDWSAVDPFDPVQSYLLFHLLDHATDPELRGRLLGDTTLANACRDHGSAMRENRELRTCLLAYDMALTLRKDQVQRQGRSELAYDLAGAYMTRGLAFDSLGQLEDALADYNVCIREGEKLRWVEDSPELRNGLAKAYMNRGTALCQLGRLEGALGDYRTCIGMYDQLVQREGRHELRKEMAMARMNMGNPLLSLGRLPEALGYYSESIGLYEELVHRDGRRELRNDMANALLNRGNALRRLGRLEEALGDYGAAIVLREELVHRENRRERRDDLAMAYMSRAVVLRKLGRTEEALRDYGMCICLEEELVCCEGRRELADNLATAHMNRGNALADLDRLDDALRDFAASIGLREELVHRQGRRELLGDLAWAYANHAGVLLRIGSRDKACRQAREAVLILQSELTRTGRADLGDALEHAEEVARNACD
jgi:tetratricopeptide (TPR) repeat protein